MAVRPVALGDAYVKTGDGLQHYEGQADFRADIADFSTDYRDGSEILCTEDFSLWVLGRQSGEKKWLELTL